MPLPLSSISSRWQKFTIISSSNDQEACLGSAAQGHISVLAYIQHAVETKYCMQNIDNCVQLPNYLQVSLITVPFPATYVYRESYPAV